MQKKLYSSAGHRHTQTYSKFFINQLSCLYLLLFELRYTEAKRKPLMWIAAGFLQLRWLQSIKCKLTDAYILDITQWQSRTQSSSWPVMHLTGVDLRANAVTVGCVGCTLATVCPASTDGCCLVTSDVIGPTDDALATSKPATISLLSW